MPLRIFLGLEEEPGCSYTSHLTAILGPAHSTKRWQLVDDLERLLECTFSRAQRDLILEWTTALLVMNCVPGAGKTTALTALSAMVILYLEDDLKVLITESSKAMADELYNLIKNIPGMPRNCVARYGFDDVHGLDHFDEFLNLSLIHI